MRMKTVCSEKKQNAYEYEKNLFMLDKPIIW